MVSVSDVYGGTHRYFTKVAKAHGVQVTFSPSIEIDVAKLIRPDETKLIWIESPSNPTLSLVDIRNVATVAHRHGIQVVVDNTFLSPYVQNPLDHGADIVIHSVTKYINGHSVSLHALLSLSRLSAKYPVVGCPHGRCCFQLRGTSRTTRIPSKRHWCRSLCLRLLACTSWSQNLAPPHTGILRQCHHCRSGPSFVPSCFGR